MNLKTVCLQKLPGNFFLFDILMTIVEMTNKKIDSGKRSLPQRVLDDGRITFVHSTNASEILAFIGLIYWRGLLGQAKGKIDKLFHNLSGSPIFGATMSKNRFRFLMSHISFDDFASRDRRWEYDRFAGFRHIFEIFMKNCGSVISPHDYLALDETLYPMRTDLNFKQYNRSKPAKYGMLFCSLNSARFPYTFTAVVYAGRPKQYNSDSCKYYERDSEETVKTLVTNLERCTNLAGRNITYDRFYISIALGKWLLERNITSVGIIHANRKGSHAELQTFNGRDAGSYEIYWNVPGKQINLNSYIVNTKSSRKRNVLMLSRLNPILEIAKNFKAKPALYKLYDFTKGGTDIVDQKISFFSCKPISRRWPIVAFSYFLDTCLVYTSTVLALNQGKDPQKQDSYDFGFD